jgi:hypothetical protein
MGIPLWVTELASCFWQEVGREEPFPRNLRRAIADALPVTIVLLPRLRLTSVDRWLEEQQIFCNVDAQDRALRACLVARRGHGLVFLDGTDPDDEQRFSLAHEIAHFPKEYWAQRRTVVERVGPSVLEVLDGDRPARAEERIHALLAHVPIGFHIHLLDRTADGHHADGTVTTAESSADLLAYELLAPADIVLRLLDAAAPAQRRAAAIDVLTKICGLPPSVASDYTSILLPSQQDHSESFIRKLGLRP